MLEPESNPDSLGVRTVHNSNKEEQKLLPKGGKGYKKKTKKNKKNKKRKTKKYY